MDLDAKDSKEDKGEDPHVLSPLLSWGGVRVGVSVPQPTLHPTPETLNFDVGLKFSVLGFQEISVGDEDMFWVWGLETPHPKL